MTITIGLCEDNNNFRESLEQYINDSPPHKVLFSLPSADSLLLHLESQKPDVILMDIDMEVINGIEATRLVKNSFPEIKILILTVYEDDDKIFDAILAGANGYLLKKTPPAKILDCIKEVYEGSGTLKSAIVKKVLTYFNQFDGVQPETDYTLSTREKTILKCIVDGDSYKMIADHCYITIGTVRSHINNIYKKLHINSKSEAVAKALKERLAE